MELNKVGRVELKVKLEFGPPIQSATPASYSHTTVVVTESSGVPQRTVTLMPGESSFTAWVKPGGGNIIATDYDLDGKVLNTAVQEFTDDGTVGEYKPVTSISVVTETSGKIKDRERDRAGTLPYHTESSQKNLAVLGTTRSADPVVDGRASNGSQTSSYTPGSSSGSTSSGVTPAPSFDKPANTPVEPTPQTHSATPTAALP